MPVLLVILLLPLIEIALFILVGSRIGIAPVLVLIVLSMFMGILVLRANQARAAAIMQHGLRNVSPGTFLAQGAFATIGGVLLLLPGFLTDSLGLLLLLPPVQRLVMRAIAARIDVKTVHVQHDGDIVEGEYKVAPDAEGERRPRQASGPEILPPRKPGEDDSRH